MATETTPPFESLGDNNYAQWQFYMKSYLVKHGYWSVLTLATVPEDKKDLDAKALATLCLKVGPQYITEAASCATAKALWDKLEARFQSKNNARKMQLEEEFVNLKMAPGESISSYADRARTLSGDLAGVGNPVKDESLALRFLAGLLSEYEIVRAVLRSNGASLTMDAILPLLLSEEQRKAPPSAGGSVALASARQSNPGGKPRTFKPAYNKRGGNKPGYPAGNNTKQSGRCCWPVGAWLPVSFPCRLRCACCAS